MLIIFRRFLPLLALIMFAIPQVTQARSFYLGWWSSYYPNSSSSDLGCQLCHQNSGGGNGWNNYGWTIRGEAAGQTNFSQFTLNSILRTIEDDAATEDDSSLANDPDASDGCAVDLAPAGSTFLDEIRYNAQPGWVLGSNNNIRFKNGSCSEDQNAPDPEIGEVTTIDLPALLSDPITDPIPTGDIALELVEVASEFNAPVKAVRAPGIDGSLFVVEQRGKVFRVDLTTGTKTLFLDIEEDLVLVRAGYDERGLLGLEFHPNFAVNGLFYTYQSEPVRLNENDQVDFSTITPGGTTDHRSMVVEYRASDPSCNSFIQERKNLIIVDQPQFNHNGGDLAFGPDGLLYLSLGDGGSSDDRDSGHGDQGNGRDNTTALGSILRIDVSGSDSLNGKYGIPEDNPFADVADQGLDEIYAYGLRNVYRFSFDAVTNALYAADVGQNMLEEVNIIEKGGNYGWNWKEGSRFFFSTDGVGTYISDQAPAGIESDLVDPIAEYDHDEGLSITGGYVYRGSNIPQLVGRYVFADYGNDFSEASGTVLYLDPLSNTVTKFFTPDPQQYFTGFGQDAELELYVLGNQSFDPEATTGILFKLMSPNTSYSAPFSEGESAICPPSQDLCFPIKTESGNISVVCL